MPSSRRRERSGIKSPGPDPEGKSPRGDPDRPPPTCLGEGFCVVTLGWHNQKPSPKRSEEHTSELQSRVELVCRLLLEKKKKIIEHKDETSDKQRDEFATD